MKQFEELDKRPVYEVEASITDFWKDNHIFQKTIDQKDSNKQFVFYDGPATANGMPGLHHMVAKFLKDTFCRYQTMKGHQVLRKIGWDTHGLPVEVQVEKKLGFNGKKDIEAFGIKKFNQECRNIVFENERAFEDLTNKMGQFIDMENRYITYDNDYIETEWWILKKYFDEGLFYEGHKIIPYCSRCGTGLASHEVAQGYEEVATDTVTVAFKKKDENIYFLVWTTTPWTLSSNVALAVHPNLTYVKVESQGTKYIIAESLVSKVFDENIVILETMSGKDLEYMEYEQLIKDFESDKKGFFVTLADYVSDSDGTGIVHIAPAFGEDDNQVGIKYNLPFLNPVGQDGCYVGGTWDGLNVFEANTPIIQFLKEKGLLFKKQRVTHNYPHCWRCKTPLIYYSTPSYYLKVTAYKDKIIENNKKINWYPEFVGEKRFGNWLEDLKDWAISRNRYWGTPLPFWICECGHTHMIGSRDELIKMATSEVNTDIDLHRPYVDDIKIKCEKCSGEMIRTSEVIDCWFDSGAMPFAQYHYPFENKDLWESQFPADFICEGIDQTRGWFYSLLVISTFVTGKSPYKNVLVNELLLDAQGKKMSKSKGNVIEPFTTMKEFGADTVRFFIPYTSPIWTPLKFGTEGLKEVYSKFFNPLKNTYNFFALYANTDNIDINDCKVSYEQREEIDRWLISKYNKLLKFVTESYDEYDLNKVNKAIANFVSEDLSNWYIRRNRNRFWASELDNSKKSVYITTYEVLIGICQMIAPVTPFITEELYQKLTKEESVHLSNFPAYDDTLIDETLEYKMDLVRNLISIGRNVREEVKIKVREPLSEVLLDGKNKEIVSDLDVLIKEELNVKNVVYVNDLSEYMNFTIKPNFKTVGKVLGPKIKEFGNILENLNESDKTHLYNGQDIIINLNGDFTVTSDMIDIRISSKEGFNVGMENNQFAILNTERTHELILEGLAREFISKIQQMRKVNDYEVIDRIHIYYEGTEIFKESITTFKEYIKNETLADLLEEKSNLTDQYDLNGENAKIKIEKV